MIEAAFKSCFITKFKIIIIYNVYHQDSREESVFDYGNLFGTPRLCYVYFWLATKNSLSIPTVQDANQPIAIAFAVSD